MHGTAFDPFEPEELKTTYYLFDFSAVLRVFEEDPTLALSIIQVQDLAVFILENIEADYVAGLNAIAVWGVNENNTPPDYFRYTQEQREKINMMLQQAYMLFWQEFHARNMFEPINLGTTSFPFVTHDVCYYSFALAKDNVISTNKVNMYAKSVI